MSSAPVLVVAFGGRIFGLDPASGQHRWMREMARTGQTQVIRLALDGERVYAAIWRDLTCLDAATGAVLWQTNVEDACSNLLVADGRVHAAGGGKMRSFNAATGALLWEDDFAGFGGGDVALALVGGDAPLALAGVTSQADRG
ncbi:MAG TPA: PQQ-binding-like beta-propeller repeat protein [Kofleriaceae bacterium]|nr:PQQ-binding-like beta-propeller repeat protein [Kofleriaceae bacterium]